MILCSVREVIIFEHGCYISALELVRMLVLGSYVLLACINPIYKYGHAWLISKMYNKFQYFGSGAVYLRFETSQEGKIWHYSSY